MSVVAKAKAKKKPERVFVVRDRDPFNVRIDFAVASSQTRQLIGFMFQNILGHATASRHGLVYPVSVLVPVWDTIVTYLDENRHIMGLDHDWVTELGELVVAEGDRMRVYAEARLRSGVIEFDDFPLVISPGSEVCFLHHEKLCGGVVKTVRHEISFIGQRYYVVSVELYTNFGGAPALGLLETHVSDFRDSIPLTELRVRMITPEEKRELEKRGEVFRRYVSGPHLVQYKGQLARASWFGSKNYRADGRVMIDFGSFQEVDRDQYNSEMRHSGVETSNNRKQQAPRDEIPDDDLWRTYPYLYGFSLRAKQWGRVSVDGISAVAWRDEAYEMLVLDDEPKKMVRSLVEHSSGKFEDLIDGKGGGCIFLLHGPPGEGKTLTAEAVAELLRRPLYSISVGELGVTPDELEERLRMILDVAIGWNAVVLLDEADIYLEARDERDLLRNAMVAVFLRLLEYHQGVLFLTTNRVRNIDTAFYSRISVGLNFPSGTVEKRRRVWENLLSAAGIDGIDVAALSRHEVNGRQIKSAIRNAQTLAEADGSRVTTDSLQRILDFASQFQRDINDYSARHQRL